MNKDVGIIMGSRSDWDTMRHASETLESLNVSFEVRVVSAHRTPDLLFDYAATAAERGLKVIIAGAGGAAQRCQRLARIAGRAVARWDQDGGAHGVTAGSNRG